MQIAHGSLSPHKSEVVGYRHGHTARSVPAHILIDAIWAKDMSVDLADTSMLQSFLRQHFRMIMRISLLITLSHFVIESLITMHDSPKRASQWTIQYSVRKFMEWSNLRGRNYKKIALKDSWMYKLIYTSRLLNCMILEKNMANLLQKIFGSKINRWCHFRSVKPASGQLRATVNRDQQRKKLHTSLYWRLSVEWS